MKKNKSAFGGKKTNIFIISGPSGAGEDSIISGLEKIFSIERIITTTTRKMRPSESQGNPYYFVSKEEFEKKLNAGNFAEHAQQYNENLYGVTNEELNRVRNSGKIGIWKIEYKGVMAIKKIHPEIIAIFINAESLKILERRIRQRDNATNQYIRERMAYTKEWLKHINAYDYTVINKEKKLEEAISKVAEIIKRNL